MLKKLLMMAFVLLVFPAAAMANFQAGNKEFTLSGSGTSDKNLDNNFISAQASLGYFFTDQIEGLIRQDASFADTENGGSNWNGSTSAAFDFHLDLDAWQPFLGGNIGYIYGDGVDETWVAGPEGGIKAFVNQTTFVQGLVQYQFFFDSASEADNNFDDGRFVYALGIGFKW